MKHNLIGISGRSGSGKDTVGSVLQWIATSKTGFGNGTYSNKECVEWLNGKYPGDTSIQKISGYQIKKFADKLKDMVCLLIGCTREQLEDREFKEKELGEEWWFYKFNDIMLPVSDRRLFIRTVNSIVFSPLDEAEVDTYIIKLTPRKLLQLLGTEAGREIIHPNIWVNALFADYSDGSIEDLGNKLKLNHLSKWIITDVRFPNEAKAIKDRGGLIIRVNRDSGQALIDKGIHIPKWNCTEEHSSETSLDNYDGFGHVIDNNGSIEELVEKVKQLKLV